MGLLSKDTPEERAAKEQRQDDARFKSAWEAFWASPAGRARLAYRAGDQLFQYALDVMNQEAIVKWAGSPTGRGDRTRSRSVDPSTILNSVCREGWELAAASFPFVATGQESRQNTPLSHKERVVVAGTVMGYYVFKRSEGNRQSETDEELQRRLLAQLDGT